MYARQCAHVFQGKVLGREVIRLAVPQEHMHRPVIIQFAGQTYFPDDVLFVQMETRLSVLISAGRCWHLHRPDCGCLQPDAAADKKILRTDDTQIPSIDCKPAEFGLPGDFPVSLPGSDHPQSRPQRPVHDGATHWSLDLGALFQTHGVLNAWDDATALSVTTWYVHHDRRPVCHRPKHLMLGNPNMTWEEPGLTLWIGDCHLRSTVKPRPPQYREHGSTCHIIPEQAHIILEQAPPLGRTVAVLTALLEGYTIQGAFSVDLRVCSTSIFRSMDIPFSVFCTTHQCTLVQNRHPVRADAWIDRIDVQPGESIFVWCNRPREPREPDSDEMIEISYTKDIDDLTFVTLMQTAGCRSNALNPLAALAPEFFPRRLTACQSTCRISPHWLTVHLRGRKRHVHCRFLHGLLRRGLGCLDAYIAVRRHCTRTIPNGKPHSKVDGWASWTRMYLCLLLLLSQGHRTLNPQSAHMSFSSSIRSLSGLHRLSRFMTLLSIEATHSGLLLHCPIKLLTLTPWPPLPIECDCQIPGTHCRFWF